MNAIFVVAFILASAWLAISLIGAHSAARDAQSSARYLANSRYRAKLREVSCYGTLWTVHQVITWLGIAACVLGMIVSLGAGSVWQGLSCAVILALVVMERGFFTAIIDAVDVLIDTRPIRD